MCKGLIGALLLGLVGTSIFAATEPPVEVGRAVAVAAGLEAIPLSWSERLDAGRHSQFTAFWQWSNESPPTRSSVADPPPETFDEALDWLDISVEMGESPLPKGLSLIAAPVEMWREVPEPLLPSWRVPASGRVRIPSSDVPWRIRLLGEGFGTDWIELPGTIRNQVLRLTPATDRRLRLVDRAGDPRAGEALQIFRTGKGRGNRVSLFRSDAEGTVVLPSLPGPLELEVMVLGETTAALIWRGRASSLPETLVLLPGAALEGSVIDARSGEPLAGVRVAVRAFTAPGSERVVARGAVSEETGAWRVEGLAIGKAQVAWSHEGFAHQSRVVELREGVMSLGRVPMESAQTVELHILGPSGIAVADAEALTSEGRRFPADAHGILRIEGMPKGRAGRATVKAPGFLPEPVTLPRQPGPPIEVRLRRTFQVVGRVVDAFGSPVPEGRTTLSLGNRSWTGEIASDGAFILDVPPRTAAVLELSVPQRVASRIDLEPGEAGERRDLGDIELSAGRAIAGQVVRKEDGLPVAGARVWTVRAPENLLLGWLEGDLLEARSDAEGFFELPGLARSSVALQVEAPGRARRHLDVALPDGAERHDLGPIELITGCRVRVVATGVEESGATARLDLRGQWHESDMLTATVSGGAAVFAHVPPGSALLSVMQGADLVCERRIEVPEEVEFEVACDESPGEVRGVVLAGDRQVGPGWLSWSTTSPRAPGVVLKNRVGELESSRVLWGGRPDVRVEVAPDGRFACRRLNAGIWRVTWTPEQGSTFGRPIEVRLEDADEQEVVLRYSLHTVEGVVTDGEGVPVARARVRELESGGFALSRDDGTFGLHGLEPGVLRLRARSGDAVSEVAAVTLTPEKPLPPVELVLGEDHDAVRIEVRDESADGVPGALVFVQSSEGSVRLLTASVAGRVDVPIEPPQPSHLRVAAFAGGRWMLGEWVSLDRALEGLVLEMGRVGEVAFTCEETCGPIALQGAGGWDLSALSLRLGRLLSVEAERPQEIAGLPIGSYRVLVAGKEVAFEVEGGESERVALP
ncbi:MAG: carboxypeptidase-like regulatory domain-containing protein [Acidobacteriota bacterium]